MSTELLEAPPSSAQEPGVIPAGPAVVTDQDTNPDIIKQREDFSKVFGPDAVKEEAKPQKQEPKQKAKAEPKPEPKREQAKPDQSNDKKSRIEALETIKKHFDDADESQSTEDESADQSADNQVQDKTPEQQKKEKEMSRWKQLKAIEDRVKSIKSLDDIEGFEELPKEVRDAIKEIKAKANGYEEVKPKLESFEKRYAIEVMENSDDFKRGVLAPINRVMGQNGIVARAAKAAGLNEVQHEALKQATDNPDPIARRREIRRIISQGGAKNAETGETEPLQEADIIDIANEVGSAVNELHNEIYPRAQVMRAQAHKIEAEERGKAAQESAAKKEEMDRLFKEDSAFVKNALKEKFGVLFDEHPEFEEALDSAKPATELREQIYEAMAGQTLPFYNKTINRLLGEVNSLKKQLKARDQASLGRSTSAAIPAAKPQEEGNKLAFEDVFGRGPMGR